MISGVRPVQTVVTDLGGHFNFNNVQRGNVYSIRVAIDGFETVDQPVRESDFGHEMFISVNLVHRPRASSGGGAVVNVSEFLERYPKKAVSYFEKGSEFLSKKKTDEAVKSLRNAVELAPTFYEAHNQLGLAYVATGQTADAEQEFIKARDLNSTAVEPLLNLMRLYLEENEPERAVTTGEQAVKVNSRSATAFYTFGVALYRTDQWDRAETALKRALNLAPKAGTIRLMLANVYLKQARYDSTLEQLNSYIAENPKGQQLQDAITMRDRLQGAGATARP
jgi:tetratricopeptide (TPR) repeat protein